jgi:hypothetical protein
LISSSCIFTFLSIFSARQKRLLKTAINSKHGKGQRHS